ncbi:ATP-dependent DNA ligase [Streptomyces tendae]
MTAAFPEIADAAFAQLPGDTGLDGELVVWEGERLAFERLQQRLARRRGAGELAAARTWPAHLVVFDVLHLDETDLTPWPYARRRTALETLFADTPLTAPFTLCPSITDPTAAWVWLTWTSAGLEGLCFKRLAEPYRPGTRARGKYKVRTITEAIVGAVTGPPAAPRCSAATTARARSATPLRCPTSRRGGWARARRRRGPSEPYGPGGRAEV